MKNIDSFKIEQTCSLPRRAVSAGGAAFAGALARRVAGAVADGAEENICGKLSSSYIETNEDVCL